MRWLVPRCWKILAWWTMRSTMAVATVTSPKHCAHWENARLDLTMIDPCSYRRETSWKNRFAVSAEFDVSAEIARNALERLEADGIVVSAQLEKRQRAGVLRKSSSCGMSSLL